MTDKQETNHAVARSLSNAGLDLLPCPFCGGDPTVHYLELQGLAVIECSNKTGCGMLPNTYENGLRYDLAKINWNQRPNVKLRGAL